MAYGGLDSRAVLTKPVQGGLWL